MNKVQERPTEYIELGGGGSGIGLLVVAFALLAILALGG